MLVDHPQKRRNVRVNVAARVKAPVSRSVVVELDLLH